MIEREKVVKGLECCIANRHNNCPYKSTDEGIDKVTSCTTYLMKDALALLKEQEAVEPRVSTAEQRCGHCNKVIEMDGWQSCPWCGKRIDWKGWWKKNGTRNQDT